MEVNKIKVAFLDRKNLVIGVLALIAISFFYIAYKVKGADFYEGFIVGSLFPEAMVKTGTGTLRKP